MLRLGHSGYTSHVLARSVALYADPAGPVAAASRPRQAHTRKRMLESSSTQVSLENPPVQAPPVGDDPSCPNVTLSRAETHNPATGNATSDSLPLARVRCFGDVVVNCVNVPLGPHAVRDPALRLDHLHFIYEKMKAGTLRILTLHGIWALLLALGWKNVENRSMRTAAVPMPNEWVLLQASSANPSDSELDSFRADALRHLTLKGNAEEAEALCTRVAALCKRKRERGREGSPHRFPSAQWVGFVRFSRVLTYEEASVPESWGSAGTSGWWRQSQGDKAWVVDASIPLLPTTPQDNMAPRGSLSMSKIKSRLQSSDWSGEQEKYFRFQDAVQENMASTAAKGAAERGQ